MGIQEKIKEIEEEIRRTQYNKATEYHIGLLKAKLAKLRAQLMAGSKKGGGGGFDVKKGGNARAVLIGYPSTGKSTLLSKITKAKSRSGAYAFTTLDVVPGLIEYKGAKIQLLDLPGIIKGASKGYGRGREVLSVARNADIVILFVDVFNPDFKGLKKELYNIGVRLDKEEPDIHITKKISGGIRISRTIKTTKLDDKTIINILGVYGIHNADVIIREDVDIDEFIDVVVGNRKYIKSMKVVNKIDLVDESALEKLKKEVGNFIRISAGANIGLEEFKEELYNRLGFIRVYTKSRFDGVDYKEPLVLKVGSTIEEVCAAIHRDLAKNFKYALIDGPSAKFKNQRVGLDHKVKDGDIVYIYSR